jgi:predicted RND superfamily exporter protein
MIVGILAVLGIGCVPVTLLLGLPAGAIKGGRETKKGVNRLREKYNKWSDKKKGEKENENHSQE